MLFVTSNNSAFVIDMFVHHSVFHKKEVKTVYARSLYCNIEESDSAEEISLTHANSDQNSALNLSF